MKNLITIMMLLMFAVTSFSQNETLDADLSYSQTFKLTGTLTDVLDVGDSTFSYVVLKRTDEKIFAVVDISLDSISGTPDTVDVFLQKKVFGADLFEDIDTVIYYGTVDTLIRFETTTAYLVDYWRIYTKERGDNFKVGIEYLNWKFGK